MPILEFAALLLAISYSLSRLCHLLAYEVPTLLRLQKLTRKAKKPNAFVGSLSNFEISCFGHRARENLIAGKDLAL